MIRVRVVTAIFCEKCGYYDNADNFVWDEEGKDTKHSAAVNEVLLKFGLDIVNNPDHLSIFEAACCGAICPECGGFAEMEFDQECIVIR